MSSTKQIRRIQFTIENQPIAMIQIDGGTRSETQKGDAIQNDGNRRRTQHVTTGTTGSPWPTRKCRNPVLASPS